MAEPAVPMMADCVSPPAASPAASPGEVMAQGVYGQYIYINPKLGVVIAVNAADRGFEDPGVEEGNLAIFRAIAAGL